VKNCSILMACILVLGAGLILTPAARAQRQRTSVPPAILETMQRYGVERQKQKPDFRTRDVPDQSMLSATCLDYSASGPTLRVETPEGKSLECFLDPQRSRILDVDGSPLSGRDLLPGTELVLVLSGRERMRVASRVFRLGVPPAPSSTPPALDPVPVREPRTGLVLRPPRGWRGTPSAKGAELLCFEPRVGQGRFLPRLILTSSPATSPGPSDRTPNHRILGETTRGSGQALIRERLAVVLIQDQVFLLHEQQIMGGPEGSLELVGWALAEDLPGLLDGFRAVGEQILEGRLSGSTPSCASPGGPSREA
jgi:hypothetical protein